jgi:hypothetical protein
MLVNAKKFTELVAHMEQMHQALGEPAEKQ